MPIFRRNDSIGPGLNGEKDARTDPRKIAQSMIASWIELFAGRAHADSLFQDTYKNWMSAKRVGKQKVLAALTNFLNETDIETRIGAATCLLLLRRSEAKATNTLVQVLQTGDDEDRKKVLVVYSMLENVPKAIHPALASLLRSDNLKMRLAAAAALKESPEAVAVLTGVLQTEKDSGLIIVAANALARMRVRTSEAVQSLLTVLRETESPDMRAAIVSLLSEMKKNAKEIGPALLALLDDRRTDRGTRQMIVTALGDLGMATDARKALYKGLRSEDWVTVCASAISFEDLDEMPPQVRQNLSRLLTHEDADARGTAALVLADYGPKAAETLPVLLQRVLIESKPEVLNALSDAIAAIGQQALADEEVLVEEISLH